MWLFLATVVVAGAMNHAPMRRLAATPLNVTQWAVDGNSVLVITAHPDDAEGFAGGLLATLQDHGAINVSYLVVTSGNAGGKCYDDWGPRPGPSGFRACEKEELGFTRRREMVAAAAYFGVPREQVYRLGLDDGMVLAHHETSIRRAITAVVRTVQPHVVLTHYPYPNLAAQPTCNGACPAPSSFDDMGSVSGVPRPSAQRHRRFTNFVSQVSPRPSESRLARDERLLRIWQRREQRLDF